MTRGDNIGESEGTDASTPDKCRYKKKFDKDLLIGLLLMIVALGAVCTYLAYGVGYFGTVEGEKGIWREQYEKMRNSRDEWRSMYNSTIGELDAMTAERDEYRDRWESDDWDVYRTRIPTYVIYLEGGTCKAQNVQKGGVEFDDLDAIKTIQAAIDALPSTGGKIFLQNGTYILSTHVTDGGKDNVILQGSGWNTTLKIQDDTQETVIDISGQTQWVILDLAIDGNKANNVQVHGGVPNDMNQNGIHFFKVTESKIIRCYVHDTVFHGINIHYQSTDNEVINCLVEECGTAGDYGASSGILIFSSSPRNRVRGCRCVNNHARGVYVSAYSSDCIISENIITGGESEAAGGIIVMDHSDRVELIHNTIYDVPGNGIDVGNRYGSTYEDVVVAGNTIVNAGYDGIWCGSEGSGVIIEDNCVKWATYYGISVRGTNSTIRNNHIFTTTDMTIYPDSYEIGNHIHQS